MKSFVDFLGRAAFSIILCGLVLSGCQSDLLDSLRNKIDEYENRLDNMEDRVAKLEELCNQQNTNIESLKTIVSAIQDKDYVTSITPVKEGENVIGYTLTFGSNEPITIYNGKDGQNGQNGQNGQDGQDAVVPQLGVKQDTDGIWYWTIDGVWLTDNNGDKVRASGKDGQNGQNGQNGKDGVTPKLKIVDGYWFISYDDGATWPSEPLGPATGEKGDSIIKNVTYDEQYVYITMPDNTVLSVPRTAGGQDADGILTYTLSASATEAVLSGYLNVSDGDIPFSKVTVYYSDSENFNINTADVATTVSFDGTKGFTINLGPLSSETEYSYSVCAKIKSQEIYGEVRKFVTPKALSFISIAEVRAMYQGSAVNVADGVAVKGVVISNKDLNNLTSSKSLYVQDATAGINVFCTAKHSFAFGDEVVFDLSGAELKDYNGLLEINNYDASKAEKVGTATPEAKTVSVDDFLAGKYQGQYVAIENCQVADADLAKKWCNSSSNTSITVDHKDGKSFVVFTSKYAATLTEVPQGSGTIKGIASVNNGTAQLIFAQESDYAGLTGDRFEGPETEEISIAKVFETPVSTTVKVKGAVVAAGTKSIVINDGGDKNLYVYINATHTWTVGNTVLVEGKVTTYGSTDVKLIQISGPTITACEESITPKSETAVELTAAQIDAFSSASSPKIKVTATVIVSGKYKNLDFGGTIVGSVVASSLDSEFTDGRVVEITGYYAATTTSSNTTSYFNILPVEVK